MAEMDWVNSLISTLQDPSVGGGAGKLPTSATDVIKAAMNVHNANAKLNDATSVVGATPNAPDQLPISETLPQIVSGGGENTMDNFLKGLDTTAGAGGLAAMLGGIGAAISKPNTWQSRLGTTAAGMGRGAVAADAVKQLTDKLAASTPVAPPGAGQPNFPVALLPLVTKLGQ